MLLSCFAFVLAGGAVAAMALAFGASEFARAWERLNGIWLLPAMGAELAAFPAYLAAYRTVARLHDGPRLPLGLSARVVLAGFGPIAPAGGFALDKRALHAIEEDRHTATVRVLGLGALEWALLAPVACACAIFLLLEGDSRVLPSLLWPWSLAVPIGLAIGLTLASAHAHRPLDKAEIERDGPLRVGLRGVAMLHALARDLPRYWAGWLGAALFWVADIACLYASTRAVGLTPTVPETVLAYATGYALTRRSSPLAGAGTTEALMTLALHWVSQPVPGALAAVCIYRAFNLALPTPLALLAHRGLEPLLDEGRRPTARRARTGAAPSPTGARQQSPLST